MQCGAACNVLQLTLRECESEKRLPYVKHGLVDERALRCSRGRVSYLMCPVEEGLERSRQQGVLFY